MWTMDQFITQNWLGLIVITGILSLVVFLIIYNKKSNEKARKKTTQWATKNGWQLLEFESRTGPGPFGGFLVSSGHGYYQSVVCDKQGKKLTGWVRYDITPFSLWDPEVRWIEKTEE